jgi:hypothetical protein
MRHEVGLFGGNLALIVRTRVTHELYNPKMSSKRKKEKEERGSNR